MKKQIPAQDDKISERFRFVEKQTLLTPYLKFWNQHIRDATNHCDKIEYIPPIPEVILEPNYNDELPFKH